MVKLKKDDFNTKYRFRESRKESLVCCTTCDSKTGGDNDENPAFCEHEERFRKIKIAEYWPGFFGPGTSNNIAPKRVCDAYASEALSEGVERPVLGEKQAMLLGSQGKDVFHADPSCPYVLEELKRIQDQDKSEDSRKQVLACYRPAIQMRDISDKVQGEVVGGALCEMPCCDSKLPYQTWRVDDYRRKVGIKPDGTEPRKWVRNGIVKHGNKVSMTLEEAAEFFDLERFNSREIGNVHRRISTVADHIHGNCNYLGSRPLSEAVNPVYLWISVFSLLKDPLAKSDNDAEFWMYDKRLFNPETKLEKPLKFLKKIPEGLILCMDKHYALRGAMSSCERHRCFSESFGIYGIVKELEDANLLSKGLSHFVEIGEVSVHASNHMWGEFGKGFGEMASFDKE